VRFKQLTPKQRRAFETDGFLHLRRALPALELRYVQAAADRLLVSFMREPENHYLDLRRDLLEEPALAGLVARPSTVGQIAQLMGPNIHLLSHALIAKKPEPPGTPPRRGWHRDLRMPKDCGHEALPLIGIKVCYCLTDFPAADTGLTKMVRGSHRLRTPLTVPAGEVDPIDGEVCDVIARAGDAILFDNRVFHSKAPNFGDRMSRVLMFGYAYRWLRPEAYLDPPDPRFWETKCLIARQLLGYRRDVDAPPRALSAWMTEHGVNPEPIPWTVDAESRAQPSILTGAKGTRP